MTCCGAARNWASPCPPPTAKSWRRSWRARRDRLRVSARRGFCLPHIRRRRTKMAAERAVEIGDIVEAAGMRELRDGQMRMTGIAQHAPHPAQALAEHEGGERGTLVLE